MIFSKPVGDLWLEAMDETTGKHNAWAARSSREPLAAIIGSAEHYPHRCSGSLWT